VPERSYGPVYHLKWSTIKPPYYQFPYITDDRVLRVHGCFFLMVGTTLIKVARICHGLQNMGMEEIDQI